MEFCPDCGTKFDIAKVSEKFLKQKGGNVYNKIINKLTSEELDDDISILLQTVKPEELIRHPSFKKLPNDEKEKVYNKIQDLLPKNKKKISKTKQPVQKEKLLERFICNNCGLTKPIKEGMMIYKKTSTTKAAHTFDDFKNIKYSKILPYTRKYICPNSKCPGIKNPAKHEAKFFRPSGSYEVIYYCMACEEMF